MGEHAPARDPQFPLRQAQHLACHVQRVVLAPPIARVRVISQPWMRAQCGGTLRSDAEHISNLEPTEDAVLWRADESPAAAIVALGCTKETPKQEEVADADPLPIKMGLGCTNLAEAATPT